MVDQVPSSIGAARLEMIKAAYKKRSTAMSEDQPDALNDIINEDRRKRRGRPKGSKNSAGPGRPRKVSKYPPPGGGSRAEEARSETRIPAFVQAARAWPAAA